MGLKEIPYEAFDNFILRTPLLPFQVFENITTENKIANDDLKKAFCQKIIKEAIFLASPILYFELEKWLVGELDIKKEAKLKASLLKYLARMSSRCTPFGLFAGCTLGTFCDKTNIKLNHFEKHRRYTRPDMNYLVALSQDLAKRDHIKSQLVYYPNSSLYTIGQKLRYFEYFYLNNKRQHQIVEIDNSVYLGKVLNKASRGATLQELADDIVDQHISSKEASNFLDELLDSQVLSSNLEPSVSGPPFVDQIVKVLSKLKDCENEIKFLKKITQDFSLLDNKMGNEVKQYLELSKELKTQPIDFDLKFLFQTDMEISAEHCKLSKALLNQIKKALALFNRITKTRLESNLIKFKEAFLERYEDRSMPLCQVLDVETGIGYIQNMESGDINPLVDGLVLPTKNNPFEERELKLNKIHSILFKKLVEALKNDVMVIKLTDADFLDFPISWDNLPDTLSSMIALINEDDGDKIHITGFGGSSAANLLGRFCHEGSLISDFSKKITQKECLLNPNKILAEIVHLPEARVGNILMRPSFRDYEIPYLAQSKLPLEKQIALDDLYISVRENRIVLFSKKNNKEVIPHLTNAHNYSVNSLPIYHFLCDMQIQQLRGYIGFDFGPLDLFFDFLPRVEYENLILHLAKWNIKKEAIDGMVSELKNEKQLISKTKEFLSTKSIPQYAMLSDGDNELLVNFSNVDSIRMFLETVKNRDRFVLTEFVHNRNSVVSSKAGYFANQLIVTFFNKEKEEKCQTDLQKMRYAKT